jgi:hypothetical protein
MLVKEQLAIQAHDDLVSARGQVKLTQSGLRDCCSSLSGRVVILGVQRLSGEPNERANGRSCPLRLVQTGHTRHIL